MKPNISYLLFAYALFAFTILVVKKSIHTPEYKQLCGLLIEARQQAELLQTDLAKKLKKPQSFVSRVEAGQRRLDVFEFLTYARILGLDPYETLQSIERTKLAKEAASANRRKKTT